jgi:hypothetical protein
MQTKKILITVKKIRYNVSQSCKESIVFLGFDSSKEYTYVFFMRSSFWVKGSFFKNYGQSLIQYIKQRGTGEIKKNKK